MRVTNISDAKSQLSRLIEQVAQGQEVVIGRHGRPVARLVPYEPIQGAARPGALKGRIIMAPDFDVWPEQEARALGLID
jgi:prevent-host-death family protein